MAFSGLKNHRNVVSGRLEGGRERSGMDMEEGWVGMGDEDEASWIQKMHRSDGEFFRVRRERVEVEDK